MVDIDERILYRLDSHDKTIGDHCIRITTLEQDHKNRDKNNDRRIVYILGGIIVLEFVFFISDKMGLLNGS